MHLYKVEPGKHRRLNIWRWMLWLSLINFGSTVAKGQKWGPDRNSAPFINLTTPVWIGITNSNRRRCSCIIFLSSSIIIKTASVYPGPSLFIFFLHWTKLSPVADLDSKGTNTQRIQVGDRWLRSNCRCSTINRQGKPWTPLSSAVDGCISGATNP